MVFHNYFAFSCVYAPTWCSTGRSFSRVLWFMLSTLRYFVLTAPLNCEPSWNRFKNCINRIFDAMIEWTNKIISFQFAQIESACSDKFIYLFIYLFIYYLFIYLFFHCFTHSWVKLAMKSLWQDCYYCFSSIRFIALAKNVIVFLQLSSDVMPLANFALPPGAIFTIFLNNFFFIVLSSRNW